MRTADAAAIYYGLKMKNNHHRHHHHHSQKEEPMTIDNIARKVSSAKPAVVTKPNNNKPVKQQEVVVAQNPVVENVAAYQPQPVGFNANNFVKHENVATQPMGGTIGFNANNFVMQPQNAVMTAFTPGQVTNKNNSVVFPQNYSIMTSKQKAEYIDGLLTNNPLIKKPMDPAPGASLQDKVNELKEHINFIEGTHTGDNGFTYLQINTMLRVLNSQKLRSAIRKADFKCVDDANNPHLTEIPLDKVASLNKRGFDIAFVLNTRYKNKKLLYFMNTVPVWNPKIQQWLDDTDMCLITTKSENGDSK